MHVIANTKDNRFSWPNREFEKFKQKERIVKQLHDHLSNHFKLLFSGLNIDYIKVFIFWIFTVID